MNTIYYVPNTYYQDHARQLKMMACKNDTDSPTGLRSKTFGYCDGRGRFIRYVAREPAQVSRTIRTRKRFIITTILIWQVLYSNGPDCYQGIANASSITHVIHRVQTCAIDHAKNTPRNQTDSRTSETYSSPNGACTYCFK